MMLEFKKYKQQTYVLMGILADVVGYNSLWRSLLFQDPAAYEQLPLVLWTVFKRDMRDRVDWSYANYIFGFADQEACIK
jgi:hypothetical protein